MPMRHCNRPVPLLLLLTWVGVVLVGCDKSPELGMVRGTITLGGQPLDEVKVRFVPDPDQGMSGESSTAYTDEQGRYELAFGREAEIPGAVVGWHRVMIVDIKSENYRGPGGQPPVRVPLAMRTTSDTPLVYEVKPGEQTIDITIEKPKR